MSKSGSTQVVPFLIASMRRHEQHDLAQQATTCWCSLFSFSEWNIKIECTKIEIFCCFRLWETIQNLKFHDPSPKPGLCPVLKKKKKKGHLSYQMSLLRSLSHIRNKFTAHMVALLLVNKRFRNFIFNWLKVLNSVSTSLQNERKKRPFEREKGAVKTTIA